MTPARSEPRTARTRRALLRAGVDLLAERPIDAIPIDDIVAAAKVGKGSFFNHFEDKHGFAEAIAAEIRADIEARVAAANRGLVDPLERLVAGLRVAVEYALSKRKRARAMLRGQEWATTRRHPLNRGLVSDLDACVVAGLVRPQAAEAGLIYWLGVNQMLMVNILEERLGRSAAADRVEAVLPMALEGLGVGPVRAAALVASTATRLRGPACLFRARPGGPGAA